MADTHTAPGCGWTTKAIWKQLFDTSAARYLETLEQLPRLSGKARGDLAAGFRDGMTTAMQHLVGMGVLVVLKEAPAAIEDAGYCDPMPEADDDGRCPTCGADLLTEACSADCDTGNEPPANSDQEPDDYPFADDPRRELPDSGYRPDPGDDRVRQGMGEPNYSEAPPAGLDDPMSWER